MVNLGDEVKDNVTGLKGIAISRQIFIQGCDKIIVQPLAHKNGLLPKCAICDEPQLKVITTQKVKMIGCRKPSK